jgi:hypothetical protein
MTKFAQVRHVMMKDLRESRWLLAVYLGLVALATAYSVELKGFGDSAFGFQMLLVVLIGMIVAASLVQADSPIRVDAHWATQPLYPSAVLGAKFALAAILLIGVPAVGQVAGLLARHVAVRDVPGALGTETMTYARWILTAMVIGAITRDLRSVIIVFVGVPVLLVVISLWGAGTQSQPARAIHYAGLMTAIIELVFVAACVALLAYLYRSRDARPLTWVAGFVAVMIGFVSVTPEPTGADVDLPASLSRTAVRLDLEPGGSTFNGVPQLSFGLWIDSLPAAQQLQFVDGFMVLHGRDGTVLRVPFGRSRSGYDFQAHATSRVTWLGETQPSRRGVHSAVPVTDSVRRLLESGIASVGLDGRVLVSTPDFADTVPLNVGSTIEHRGERTRLTKWTYGLGRASVSLNSLAVVLQPKPSVPFSAGQWELEYSLVNEVRHEAVALQSRGGSSQMGWLVLPGTQTMSTTVQLETPMEHTGVRAASIDDDWFRDARLVITHWVPKGSYPVHSDGGAVPSFLPFGKDDAAKGRAP